MSEEHIKFEIFEWIKDKSDQEQFEFYNRLGSWMQHRMQCIQAKANGEFVEVVNDKPSE